MAIWNDKALRNPLSAMKYQCPHENSNLHIPQLLWDKGCSSSLSLHTKFHTHIALTHQWGCVDQEASKLGSHFSFCLLLKYLKSAFTLIWSLATSKIKRCQKQLECRFLQKGENKSLLLSHHGLSGYHTVDAHHSTGLTGDIKYYLNRIPSKKES